MMFDTLTSTSFADHIGRHLTVEAAEAELRLLVTNVREHPMAAGPNAKRTPFCVFLRGPESPCLRDGRYDLRTDGEDGWRLQGIYLNRIIPPADSDGTGAFYQLVFG